MRKITIGIEGMACSMCESHINETIRKHFSVKKVSSSHTKKQAVILTEHEISEQQLKDVIAPTGYEVVSVQSEPYTKKGIFSAFKK